MKILMLVPQPFFQVRGTPLAILQILKSLGGKGHAIDVVTYPVGDDVSLPDVTIHRAAKLPWIRSVKVGPSAAKLVLDVFLFFRALGLLLRSRYDVIHAVEESVFMAVLFKMFFGGRVIYDMDSVISDQLYYTRFVKRPWLLSFVRRLEYWAIHHSIAVLTVCRALTDQVRQINAGKPVFQVEDIPVEDFSTAPDPQIAALLTREFGLEGRRIALYSGNFESYQGVDLLVRAASYLRERMQDFCIVFVGGDEKAVEDMRSLASELGCADFVRFAGRRPVNEMPVFYRWADVLVSPRREGTNTPLKIYSYMRAGKPVLATAILSHTQVLNSSNAFLVEPSPRALAEGLFVLFHDAALCCRLGRNALRETEEKYNYETLEKKIRELYDFVATARRRRDKV